MQIYGKEGQFDAARLVDLLGAYESFKVASTSARGSMDSAEILDASSATALPQGAAPGRYEPGSALHQVRIYSALPECDAVNASYWMPSTVVAALVVHCYECSAHGRALDFMQGLLS